MFTHFDISDQERGLLVRNGRLERWLEPGRHRVFRGTANLELKRVPRTLVESPYTPELKAVAPEGTVRETFVPANCLGLLSVDGLPRSVLAPGRYLVWQLMGQARVDMLDLEPLKPEVPEAFRHLMPGTLIQSVLVHQGERALVLVDGVLKEVLREGRHVYSVLNRKLDVVRVDVREQEVQVLGQELMTRDKVTLRLNLLAKYQVVDPVRAVQSVPVMRDAIYGEVQLAVRHFVAERSLDELLERPSLAEAAEVLQPRLAEWGVELRTLDVKDLVLPGEMKQLFNQVIEAEKKAAAQVILRREEVASTRSLANTAQMLERNPALLRLKELEAFKEIAAVVPNLTVVVGAESLLKGRTVGP